MQSENKHMNLLQLLKRLLTLYVNDVKLTSAEKITLMLSGIATFSIVMAFSVLGLVFITISAANLLDTVIASYFSYLILGCVFIIAGVLLVVFKKELVVNPIARFVSKLLLDSPQAKSEEKRR